MSELAKVAYLDLSKDKRVICISDIHGHLDLLIGLLDKIKFSPDDILLLLGDFYTKGPKGEETLAYVIELSQKTNVHALRGNSDWITDDLPPAQRQWIESLPHIIETTDYTFVHGGLTSGDLAQQNAWKCMKNDRFLEQDLVFDKYVIVGHYPSTCFCPKIPCNNPIIDEQKRIISIDGGTIEISGQLNALIIQNGTFCFAHTDAFPLYRVEKDQPESGGTFNITFGGRFIELVDPNEEFSTYRQVATGRVFSLPNERAWTDHEGNLCVTSMATDYHLPVRAGETVSLIKRYSDRIYAKKQGTMGWILL